MEELQPGAATRFGMLNDTPLQTQCGNSNRVTCKQAVVAIRT